MNRYRITKYNPELRDENGYYFKNEWTSVCEIGKVFSDGIFTLDDYLKTESKYIQTLKAILEENKISKLIINNLEKYDADKAFPPLSSADKDFFDKVKNNLCIDLSEIEQITKLSLRELLWCQLHSESKNLVVEFGYDYYMYINCHQISSHTIQSFFTEGIFIELLP